MPCQCDYYHLLTRLQSFNTLLTDINHHSPSAAIASTGPVRYTLAAALVACLEDIFAAIGLGWAFTLLAGFIVLAFGLLTCEHAWGLGWRQAAADGTLRRYGGDEP